MFNSVIVGVDGSVGDADATALAELLAAPGALVIPTNVPAAQAPSDGLHDAAIKLGADLIVVGSSRRGVLGRVLAGDDVTATLRSAPCAVAVAPHGFAARPNAIARVGVGYDGGAPARAAIEIAKAIAARNGAEVRALGVMMPAQGSSIRSASRQLRPSTRVASRQDGASHNLSPTSLPMPSTAALVRSSQSSRRWSICSSSAHRVEAPSGE